NFHALTQSGAEGEKIGSQIVSEHTNIAAAIYIDIQQQAPFSQQPIARREASRRFAIKLNGRRGLFITRLDLAAPEHGFNSDAERQRRFFLEANALIVRHVFAPPVFFEAIWSAEVNPRPFADHKGEAPELADFLLDV